MVRAYGREDYDEDEGQPVDPSRLSFLTLVLGWMGAHKFYLRNDNGGAIYFLVTVLGLVLTLYMPIWVTIFDLDINLAIVILLLPLVVSIIEFFVQRRYSMGELHQRYRATEESLTLVFVSQFIYLIILVIPAIFRVFSD